MLKGGLNHKYCCKFLSAMLPSACDVEGRRDVISLDLNPRGALTHFMGSVITRSLCEGVDSADLDVVFLRVLLER